MKTFKTWLLASAAAHQPKDAAEIASDYREEALRLAINVGHVRAEPSLRQAALQSALRPASEESVQWGAEGAAYAHHHLQAAGLKSRAMPAAWEAEMSEAASLVSAGKVYELSARASAASPQPSDGKLLQASGVGAARKARQTGDWREYWSDKRDETIQLADFLEWAVSLKDQENGWLKLNYPEGLKRRVTMNTDKMQTFTRKSLLAARAANAPQVDERASTLIFKSQSVGTPPPRRAPIRGLVEEPTPPKWKKTAKTIRPRAREAELIPNKLWDRAEIQISPKMLFQVREDVVAVEAKPMRGVERTDRDYFGKDVQERVPARPWLHYWNPLALYDTWWL